MISYVAFQTHKRIIGLMLNVERTQNVRNVVVEGYVKYIQDFTCQGQKTKVRCPSNPEIQRNI
jgi:hypothetical protein